MTALTDWLLEAETPSIRYFTLTRLLHKPVDAPDATAVFHEVMTTDPVAEIFAGQSPAGNWSHDRSFYTPKYTSTHWSMQLLVELGVDGGDPRFQEGVDFMLDDTQDWLKTVTGFGCFWGNLLRYAVHAGKLDDPRVQTIIDYVTDQSDWRCEHNAHRSCAWGAARVLWGLAAIAPEARSSTVQQTIDNALDLLLERYPLHEATYPGDVSKLWHKLNFPLFYQADILSVLHTLAELDALDHPRVHPALNWLESQRLKNGRWRGSSPFSGRTWGAVSESSRWVSLYAATILEAA